MKGGNNIGFKRKFISLIFLLGMIVSLICVFAGITKIDKKEFIPRFTEPEYSNSYYYSDNVFYKSGFGIPNCTAYAWGRVYEMLNKKPNLSTGNARDWFDYNKENNIYPYGNEPKLGAVACFNNEYGGHVAVIENICKNTITFSNSAYNGESFYLSYADINDNNPGQKGWIFQGYIYPDEFKIKSRTLNCVRIVDADDGLNFRTSASLNSKILAVLPRDSYVYITSLSVNDGYTWGEAYYNGIKGYLVYDYTKNRIA